MDVKMDPWYQSINWDAVYNLRIDNPPYTPKVENEGDTSNFDAYPDPVENVSVELSDKDAALFKTFYDMRKVSLGLDD